MRKYLLIAGLVLIVVAGLFLIFYKKIAPNGLIIVDSPRSGGVISSPLQFSGKARGFWYFEASFPVRVYDDQNNLLGTGIATAKTDWMTEDYVEFAGEVEFSAPGTKTGKVVFEKDNPSGLPEYDDSYEVAIKFGEAEALELITASGFKASVFARDLPGARVIREDVLGNFWVSQTSEGVVSLLLVEGGGVVNAAPVFKDLKNPHGLAFSPQNPFRLLIAEEDRLIAVPTYSEPDIEKIADLPSGGSHVSRTIGFGPDGGLYVAIGSTCNVCREDDERRAVILRREANGTNFQPYAKGLRNSVFFTWRDDGKMFATEMGRDFLGDDLPPDEINIIREGNYGWPICYGKNIHDGDFDKNVYFRNPCMEPFEAGSYIDIPAHSAPLGLDFIPENSSWPRAYWGDLLVAYHGSWNRSVPTGYKVVRYLFDDSGNYEGISEDFLTGFLREDGTVLGRPVDILIKDDGSVLITDDYAGVVYRVVIQ